MVLSNNSISVTAKLSSSAGLFSSQISAIKSVTCCLATFQRSECSLNLESDNKEETADLTIPLAILILARINLQGHVTVSSNCRRFGLRFQSLLFSIIYGRNNHNSVDCFFRDAECRICGEKGHLAAICGHSKSTKPAQRSQATQRRKLKTGSDKWVEEDFCNSAESSEELPIYTFTNNNTPLHANLLLNGTVVRMEVDTGAAVSLMPISKFRVLFPDSSLQQSRVTLRT